MLRIRRFDDPADYAFKITYNELDSGGSQDRFIFISNKRNLELIKECLSNTSFDKIRIEKGELELKKIPLSHHVLEAILKNSTVREVDAPPAFFNASQQRILQEHLEKNRNSKFYIELYATKERLIPFPAGFGIVRYYDNRVEEYHENYVIQGSNEQELINACRFLYKRSFKKKVVEVSVYGSKYQPPYVVNTLHDALLKTLYLRRVHREPGFFTEKQEQDLERHLRKNNKPIRHYTPPNWTIWFALSGLVCSFLMGYSAFAIIGVVVGSALIGKIYPFLRQHVLDELGRRYSHFDMGAMATRTTYGEKVALKEGLKSRKWKGYILSYFNYRCYTNYRAYACGLNAGIHDKRDITREIKKLSV